MSLEFSSLPSPRRRVYVESYFEMDLKKKGKVAKTPGRNPAT